MKSWTAEWKGGKAFIFSEGNISTGSLVFLLSAYLLFTIPLAFANYYQGFKEFQNWLYKKMQSNVWPWNYGEYL